MAEATHVQSSWVSSVSYSGGVLAVSTKNGRSFHFVGVPASLYEELLRAESKGEFINRRIKGKYKSL
jgi:hypothetical protein